MKMYFKRLTILSLLMLALLSIILSGIIESAGQKTFSASSVHLIVGAVSRNPGGDSRRIIDIGL